MDNLKNMKKIKVLDCTCRDGGYYNLWNFDINQINKYLLFSSKAKVDIIEIGFVFPKNNNYGPFAYSQKNLFNKLHIPKNLDICVMINAKDFYKIKSKQSISEVFKNAEKSPFKNIRIAINFDEFYFGKEICKELKKLKYKVGFNLMQSHNKNYNQIKNVAKNITKWKSVDYLYFADTLGCMEPEYVNFFCKTIKKYWSKDIGIHAHNNKSFALINTLEAIKSGATMVDSTILGMGRGAGNLCTENLLIELKNKNYNDNPEYLTYILPYFQDLKNKYNWGPNYFYHYSAVNNIHPTYIQKLLSSNRYDNNFINETIKNLAKQNSEIFKIDYLDNQIYKKKDNLADFNAKNLFYQNNILIVGSGESGKTQLKKTLEFIKKNNPIVISLNINPFIENEYIDYYVSCVDFRVFFELWELLKKKKPIIVHLNRFKENMQLNYKKDKIINYGLETKRGSFNSFSNFCEIDKPLAIIYALAFCQIAKPKKINLAFIDCFRDNSKENKYLIRFINRFKKKTKIKINFITAST